MARWQPRLLKLTLALAVAYLLPLSLIYVLQRQLIYAPAVERTPPQAVALAGVHEVILRLADGAALYSWHAPAPPGGETILYFHGNGGSIRHRTRPLKEFTARGYGFFILGYPGYGGSQGTPSQASFVAAAELAYDYLVDAGVAPDGLVLHGQSLGSAVAVQLAVRRPVGAVVLTAPMSSVRDIAESQYPWLPVRWLLKDPFLSSSVVSTIDAPLLIVHGREDRIIPIESGRALFAAAAEPKTFVAIDGARHNDLYQFGLVARVDDFLTSR